MVKSTMSLDDDSSARSAIEQTRCSGVLSNVGALFRDLLREPVRQLQGRVCSQLSAISKDSLVSPEGHCSSAAGNEDGGARPSRPLLRGGRCWARQTLRDKAVSAWTGSNRVVSAFDLSTSSRRDATGRGRREERLARRLTVESSRNSVTDRNAAMFASAGGCQALCEQGDSLEGREAPVQALP